jgi:hypothetical protein
MLAQIQAAANNNTYTACRVNLGPGSNASAAKTDSHFRKLGSFSVLNRVALFLIVTESSDDVTASKNFKQDRRMRQC